MSARARLRKLEREMRMQPCTECKLRPEGPGYVVLLEADDPPRGQEFCERCGRPLYFVIRVCYEDVSAPGRGGA
jgi:hypothetical protein